MSNAISIHFHLRGNANAHELTFRFDHEADLPKRIAIIIGKNGVGKSQTLRRIVEASLAGNNSILDAETGNRVLVNRILAFAPTNEAGSVFPPGRRKRSSMWYRRLSLNRKNSRRGRSGTSDVILQVARSEQLLGNNSRWEIFLGAIDSISNWQEISLPNINRDHPAIPLTRLRRQREHLLLETFAAVDTHAEPVRIVEGQSHALSSGEISFLRFAAQASLYIENGSLLLLDEPETHLHPNFISRFVLLLDTLLAQTGSAAIIATHSVYFVREVFQDQVTVLRIGPDRHVISESPMLRTFGADVGAISYFVFGEDEPSKLAESVKDRLLSRNESWGRIFEHYKDQLSLELLGEIRDSIESVNEK